MPLTPNSRLYEQKLEKARKRYESRHAFSTERARKAAEMRFSTPAPKAPSGWQLDPRVSTKREYKFNKDAGNFMAQSIIEPTKSIAQILNESANQVGLPKNIVARGLGAGTGAFVDFLQKSGKYHNDANTPKYVQNLIEGNASGKVTPMDFVEASSVLPWGKGVKIAKNVLEEGIPIVVPFSAGGLGVMRYKFIKDFGSKFKAVEEGLKEAKRLGEVSSEIPRIAVNPSPKVMTTSALDYLSRIGHEIDPSTLTATGQGKRAAYRIGDIENFKQSVLNSVGASGAQIGGTLGVSNVDLGILGPEFMHIMQFGQHAGNVPVLNRGRGVVTAVVDPIEVVMRKADNTFKEGADKMKSAFEKAFGGTGHGIVFEAPPSTRESATNWMGNLADALGMETAHTIGTVKSAAGKRNEGLSQMITNANDHMQRKTLEALIAGVYHRAGAPADVIQKWMTHIANPNTNNAVINFIINSRKAGNILRDTPAALVKPKEDPRIGAAFNEILLGKNKLGDAYRESDILTQEIKSGLGLPTHIENTINALAAETDKQIVKIRNSRNIPSELKSQLETKYYDELAAQVAVIVKGIWN